MTSPIAERLRGLAEVTTPGPWKADSDNYGRSVDHFVTDGKFNITADLSPANAEFIAACRDGVPTLLAEIDALRLALAEAEERAKMAEDKVERVTRGLEQIAPHHQGHQSPCGKIIADLLGREFPLRAPFTRLSDRRT